MIYAYELHELNQTQYVSYIYLHSNNSEISHYKYENYNYYTTLFVNKCSCLFMVNFFLF